MSKKANYLKVLIAILKGNVAVITLNKQCLLWALACRNIYRTAFMLWLNLPLLSRVSKLHKNLFVRMGNFFTSFIICKKCTLFSLFSSDGASEKRNKAMILHAAILIFFSSDW